jgi:hypothetical protein
MLECCESLQAGALRLSGNPKGKAAQCLRGFAPETLTVTVKYQLLKSVNRNIKAGQ